MYIHSTVGLLLTLYLLYRNCMFVFHYGKLMHNQYLPIFYTIVQPYSKTFLAKYIRICHRHASLSHNHDEAALLMQDLGDIQG